MRVLFITGLTGYGLGGARAETTRLVRAVQAQGIDLALAMDVLPEPLAHVRHFPLDYPDVPARKPQIQQALAAFRPDLVHVLGGGIRMLWLANEQLADVPWVFTAHNVPPAERIFHHWFGHTTLHYAARNLLAMPSTISWKLLLRRAGFDKVICHSKAVFDRVQCCGCPTEKAVKIAFGAEALPVAESSAPSPFPSDAFPRILTVAGLAPHKGHLDAVRVARRLLKDYPKLAYRMIGGGRQHDYADYVSGYIRECGLEANMSIIHRAPEQVKFAALRDADLYIQPSHEEGFCIAFLEASMLVPRLVGTNTGEIASIAGQDPTTAIVPTKNVKALETATRKLLATTPTDAMVAARRARILSQYTWSDYLKQHLDLYKALLSQPAAPAPTRARAIVATPGAELYR